MAGFLTSSVPTSTAPAGSSDCLPCATLRSALTQCGTCGQPQPCQCPSPEYPAPCRPGDTADPQCPNCCVPQGQHPTQRPCPAGDVASSGGGCPQGYVFDPSSPGCCTPSMRPGQCPSNEHPQPCGTDEVLDPQTGCCQSSICPCGGTPPSGTYPNLTCPAGTTRNACNCCSPGQLPAPCAAPNAAPTNGACPVGYQLDPQSGCCKPMAVEATFVCPSGLAELTAALNGQPNQCYLAQQSFLPGPVLPAPMAP